MHLRASEPYPAVHAPCALARIPSIVEAGGASPGASQHRPLCGCGAQRLAWASGLGRFSSGRKRESVPSATLRHADFLSLDLSLARLLARCDWPAELYPRVVRPTCSASHRTAGPGPDRRTGPAERTPHSVPALALRVRLPARPGSASLGLAPGAAALHHGAAGGGNCRQADADTPHTSTAAAFMHLGEDGHGTGTGTDESHMALAPRYPRRRGATRRDARRRTRAQARARAGISRGPSWPEPASRAPHCAAAASTGRFRQSPQEQHAQGPTV